MSCSVPGCSNEAGLPGTARGLCRAHYHRWQRYGTPLEPSRRVVSWKGERCCEDGCEKPVAANGLCTNHYAVTRRRADPEGNRRRSAAFKGRYRAKQEAAMGRPRPSCCELCHEPGYGRKPAIVFDHDHATGKPRGWLCDRCNKMLGMARDDERLLRKLADYLEAHRYGEADSKTA